MPETQWSRAGFGGKEGGERGKRKRRKEKGDAVAILEFLDYLFQNWKLKPLRILYFPDAWPRSSHAVA